MLAAAIGQTLRLHRCGRFYSGACPACGYAGAFTVQERCGRTLVRCHVGCSQETVLGALRQAGLWGSPAAFTHPALRRALGRAVENDRAHARAALAERIWRASIALPGTLGEAYLHARGLHGTAPDQLRFALLLRHHPTGTEWPAMVAAVRDVSGNMVGVHRTYLRPDGAGKAPVTPAKMTLGSTGGAGVQLAPAAADMLVGEGIESTLSAMLAAGLPAWAGLSAGGMKALQLPPLPLGRSVIIAADADPVGIAAARDAAARWHAEGRAVRIALPPAGQDFNDLAMGGSNVA